MSKEKMSQDTIKSILGRYLKSNKKIESERGSFIIKKGQVAQGGTSVIREVSKEGDTQKYVIKFLSKLDETAYKRFEQAFNAISKLKSDAILPQIYLSSLKISEEISIPYVLMPKAKGGTLKDFREKNKITFRIFESIFNRMMYLLQEIHNNGIIHRDLKPENIFFLEDNNNIDSMINSMVLGDFDIAKFDEKSYEKLLETKDNERLANYLFSAPEQKEKAKKFDDITYSADLYAFGQILYWLVMGETLQGQNKIKFSRYDKRFEKYEPIVENLLQDDSNDRFQSVEEIEKALSNKLTLFEKYKKYFIISLLFVLIMSFVALYLSIENDNNQELTVNGNGNQVNQINSSATEVQKNEQKINVEGSDNNLTQQNKQDNNLKQNNQEIQLHGSNNTIKQEVNIFKEGNTKTFYLTMLNRFNRALLNVKFFKDKECKQDIPLYPKSHNNIYTLVKLPIKKGEFKKIYINYTNKETNEHINCRLLKLDPNRDSYRFRCYTNRYSDSPNECEEK